MDIPIELFITFIASSIALALFGFLRNPQIPAMLAFGGIFILVMVVMTDNIIITYNTNAVGERSVILHEQVQSSLQFSMGSANVNSTGQIILANNELIGQEIDTIALFLFKLGNPTGTITVGTMGSTAGTFNQVFNTMDASVLTTSSAQYNFTLPANTNYTVQEDDRIGIVFNGGDIDNVLRIRYWHLNSIIANENLQTSSTTTWSDFPNSDLTYRIYGITSTIDTTPVLFEFTEFPKVIFSLLGVIFMLSGALMIFKENS